MVDLVYEESDTDLRRIGGISEDEDVFACRQGGQDPLGLAGAEPLHRFRGLRVIGLFEHSISQLVAWRPSAHRRGDWRQHGQPDHHHDSASLALQHPAGQRLLPAVARLGVALINGLVWGGTMGVATYFLYQDAALGAVMTLAMVLNLLVAP